MNARQLIGLTSVTTFIDAQFTSMMFLLFGATAYANEQNFAIRAFVPKLLYAAPFAFLPFELIFCVTPVLVLYVWIPRFSHWPLFQKTLRGASMFFAVLPLIGPISWILWMTI